MNPLRNIAASPLMHSGAAVKTRISSARLGAASEPYRGQPVAASSGDAGFTFGERMNNGFQAAKTYFRPGELGNNLKRHAIWGAAWGIVVGIATHGAALPIILHWIPLLIGVDIVARFLDGFFRSPEETPYYQA